MGDVIRFPVEKVPGYFDPETYCATPAVILVLPVVRVDRDEPEGPAPGRRRRRRRPCDSGNSVTEALTWLAGDPERAARSILVVIFVLAAAWIVEISIDKRGNQ